MLLAGQQIDRYRLVRLLGSGGMGDVYLAEDARIGQQVAVKVIRSDISPYPNEHAAKEAAHLFQREAKAIVMLDHPHILPLFDYGEQLIDDVTLIYLVMPYRKEGSLAKWLNGREQVGPLSPQEVVHIVQQAAQALQHAHDHQIIHQDVKPSNFLIRIRKEAPLHPDVLLADFGIARLITTTSSASQSVRGTPTYMAPEQCVGHPVPASDQYALAVMAYELLTGRPPFHGAAMQVMYQHMHEQPQPPSLFNPQLSKEVDAALLRGLAKKPEERFASITAFTNAFHQAVQSIQKIDGLPLGTAPNTPTQEADVLVSAAPPAALSSTLAVIASDPSIRVSPDASATLARTSDVPVIESPIASVALLNASSDRKVLPHRRIKRRPFLIAALLLLVCLLLVSGAMYAAPGIITSLSQHLSGTLSGGSSTLSSARVTISPAIAALQHTYTLSAVTGTAIAAKQQVGARLLSFTTAAQTQMARATGVGTIPGTHASGIVAIDNFDTSSPLTLTAGSVFTNTYGTVNIHMILDATVTIPPAPSTTVWSQRLAPGHILEIGAIGNNEFNNNISGSISWSVFDNPPFSNGKDPGTYTAVQQSNIDGAANALIAANTPNPQQVLQGLMHVNERLVSSRQCTPKVNADHSAGDQATRVTVTVSFTCTGEVYDQAGAMVMASQLLNAQATADLGASYTLMDKVTTTLTHAIVTDAERGTITLTVDARGTWAFQLTDVQMQVLRREIAGKTKSQAQAFLAGQKGVATVEVQVWGGDGRTLPVDIRRITLVVQAKSAGLGTATPSNS